MGALYHLSWRGYPALALAVVGIVLVVRAGWGERKAVQWYRFGTDARLLTLIRDFRHAVIGLAFAGIAAAWYWQIPWLLAVAVILGAGETFETSNDIAALTQAERQSRRRADAVKNGL